MANNAEKIRLAATEIGFDAVGFARADALEKEAVGLADWLSRGFAGEMAWLEREPERRTDPRVHYPKAVTVVAVAMNYYTPFEHDDDLEKGKISRYAWGDDYHDIVKEKLWQLLAAIKGIIPGSDGIACVDTSPVMDKAWAVRSGLGWLGKHSNVINPNIGSWFFIGEILMDAAVDDTSVEVEDHCGTCTACIDACPTGAIVQPYMVDSRKCISYATIELRGDELPDEVAGDLNGWLYGCDICQDVCPWNRFEKPTSELRFEPRAGETAIGLDKILSLEQDNYSARFKKSPMKRTKLSGLKRNADALKKNAGGR